MELFKKEYLEEIEKKKNKSKWMIYLTIILIKFNVIVMWITILLNGLFIVLMLKDFNVGILLFIMNQYLVLCYYIKVRKERSKN